MSNIRLSSRDAILEAAFQLYARRPDASLAEVAQRAGVGRATLHRHFGSREALIAALAQAAMDEVDRAVDDATRDAESPLEGLRLAMAAVIPLGDRQGFLALERPEQDPQVAARHAEGERELRAGIAAAQAAGELPAALPAGWLAKTFEALVYAAWEQVRDGEATRAQAVDLAWRSFLHGAKGDPQ